MMKKKLICVCVCVLYLSQFKALMLPFGLHSVHQIKDYLTYRREVIKHYRRKSMKSLILPSLSRFSPHLQFERPQQNIIVFCSGESGFTVNCPVFFTQHNYVVFSTHNSSTPSIPQQKKPAWLSERIVMSFGFCSVQLFYQLNRIRLN